MKGYWYEKINFTAALNFNISFVINIVINIQIQVKLAKINFINLWSFCNIQKFLLYLFVLNKKYINDRIW